VLTAMFANSNVLHTNRQNFTVIKRCQRFLMTNFIIIVELTRGSIGYMDRVCSP